MPWVPRGSAPQFFRRDRQYFDYNLLDNPLVPAGVTSNGYTFPQVLDSPHLFNTVRRMTDVNLTLLPLSRFRFKAGYSQNINQGPSYSSLHNGDEALFLQNWRNSTDSWLGAVDWKLFSRTVLTYEEHTTHYKGDTNWQLTGLNMQLSNGTPVTIGFDNVAPLNAATGFRPLSVARPRHLRPTLLVLDTRNIRAMNLCARSLRLRNSDSKVRMSRMF